MCSVFIKQLVDSRHMSFDIAVPNVEIIEQKVLKCSTFVTNKSLNARNGRTNVTNGATNATKIAINITKVAINSTKVAINVT
jgi:hypothetical protein